MACRPQGMRGATRRATLSGVSEVADGQRHATRRITILIGDQAETDMAARDLIVLMRELGRVTDENAALRQRADEATRNENIGCSRAEQSNACSNAPTRWTAHTSLSSPPSAPVSRDEQRHRHLRWHNGLLLVALATRVNTMTRPAFVPVDQRLAGLAPGDHRHRQAVFFRRMRRWRRRCRWRRYWKQRGY